MVLLSFPPKTSKETIKYLFLSRNTERSYQPKGYNICKRMEALMKTPCRRLGLAFHLPVKIHEARLRSPSGISSEKEIKTDFTPIDTQTLRII
ncbi:hypothetical protein Y1Q_0009696 [Alligator mississippiensis]|uniref:Uncharacterized protein n=1 Tax=Alligator mississippiensis TaxID=8496 RepID=A0A151MWL1_ALLMI|nr:hypothetical protein Y1Q_0009696 [Alligator mississippiensis]